MKSLARLYAASVRKEILVITPRGELRYIFRYVILSGVCLMLWSHIAPAAELPEIPDAIIKNLDSGITQEVIVLYDDQLVEKDSAEMRRQMSLDRDDDTIIAFKALQYRSLKQRAESGFADTETYTISDYSHLPMTFMRFRSRSALQKYINRPEIKAVYENSPIYPHLAYSLPFINQPSAAHAGLTGGGQTVAIIDTGIDYTLPSFGSCTEPGIPAGCRVAASTDVTGNNVTLNKTANNHGTNVAGIVAGVAPASRIAAINAFSGGSSSTNWVIAGINWAIANKSTYAISAINMSLGDGTNYTSPCSNSRTNPFKTPIYNALAAGIIPVASSGNSAFTNGMSSPACTPGVVSVGAVYDASWGGPFSWGSGCSDVSAAAPDLIPCFSNSASFLTMLAPGAFITAAGIQMAGTSQAAPHVAGALAVLRSAFPNDTTDQSIARMTATGIPVNDPRNGIVKPRLNVMAAIGSPANDLFNNRFIMNGDSGQLTANNLNATRESGEPNHAGISGGTSVWWSWTPTTTGIATIDTHGSNFDTVLAVYTGTTLSTLAPVVSNDNDGFAGAASGVSFVAHADSTYAIAVDGSNGASGQISLNWTLEQQADLAITLTAPENSVITGTPLSYDLTVTNNGPSSAGAVTITDIIPAGSIIDSIPAGCSESSGTVNCSFGTILPGESTAAHIQLHFTIPGIYLSTAQVSSSTRDLFLTNNTATDSVTGTPESPLPVPGLPLPLAGVAVLVLAFMRTHRRT